MARSSLEVAAAWLAAGLDTDRAVFYRQSDIREIPELTWILTTLTAKGLMNRSHAYKAQTDANLNAQVKDPDRGITMGLFCYPILMAADILMFHADRVPVGKDQRQHVEMARDIAQRFNHHYGSLLTVPEADIDEHRAVLLGPDGRKMSKELRQHHPAVLPGQETPQAHHAGKDQLANARRTQGPGRQHSVRHVPLGGPLRGDGGNARAVCSRHRLGGDEKRAV